MKHKQDDILLFACIERNIGDDLFIQTLCNRYPKHNFIISDKAKYGSLSRIDNLKFSKVLKWWLLFDSVSSRNVVKSGVSRIIKAFLQIILGKHKIGVYIVGNAFKNTNYSDASQLDWLKNRIALSREFYLLSTNFGPYSDERWRNDALKCFETVTDVCFRDLKSYELFENLNNVRYAPDAILSLGKQKKMKSKKNILISVIDCKLSSRETWLKNLSSIYENKLVEIIKLFREQGYNIILLNSNTKQDSPASDRIKSHFLANEIAVFNYTGDLDKLQDLYSSAEYVIGTRLHTIILAWLFDIPVYPIVYDIKVENILKSYLFKGKYTLISTIDKISAESVWENLSNYKGIESEIIKSASKQFAVLDKELNNES